MKSVLDRHHLKRAFDDLRALNEQAAQVAARLEEISAHSTTSTWAGPVLQSAARATSEGHWEVALVLIEQALAAGPPVTPSASHAPGSSLRRMAASKPVMARSY